MELEAELIDLGARVTLVACDISDRDALKVVIDELREQDSPLTAVVHAAGVLADSVVESLALEQVDQALRAKVGGAVNLHELTLNLDLTAFVVFSSIAATLGIPGQGNYAPGNSFLDALAEQRRAAGLAATSIAWGPWDSEGMATVGSVRERLQSHGVLAMAPGRALDALDRALAANETCLTVADIDWERFFLAYTASRPRPLIDEVREVREVRDQRIPSPEAPRNPRFPRCPSSLHRGQGTSRTEFSQISSVRMLRLCSVTPRCSPCRSSGPSRT